ncbi:MAG: ribosome small subunit-dependent GTPase A [Actinobacteria bacterium]|nr:ribosome small subunit-dependent GTPase A [Actinomycetota bacterium]
MATLYCRSCVKNRYDEDSVRIRPARNSRPRSKDRPSHDSAQAALVTTIDRGRYTCVLLGQLDHELTAITARELGKSAVVVGDRVDLVGDLSGAPGSLARIVRVQDRSSSLRRTADDTEGTERLLVANADQLAIVVAAAQPDPQPRLIDRCLIAGLNEKMKIILIITKTDLTEPTELIAAYQDLVSQIIMTTKNIDLPELQNSLAGHVTVLVGSSGVGKSTLVNALLPAAARRTGDVNEVTGRGRHTSTSAEAIALDDNTWIIDTPGIRTFGIAHVSSATLAEAFPDLTDYLANCLKSCQHDQTDCGLTQIPESNQKLITRADSLRRLIVSKSN